MRTQNNKYNHKVRHQVVVYVGLLFSLFAYIQPLQAGDNSSDFCKKALSCYSSMVSSYADKNTTQLSQEKQICDRLKERCEQLKKTNNKPSSSTTSLQQAYNAYQQAFERYTSLVTTSNGADPADIQKAIEKYRGSYAQYKKLKDALRGAAGKPEKKETLDTTGIDGIVDIDPSDVENNIEYIEGLRKRDQSPKPAKSLQNKVKIQNNTITADQYHFGIRIKPDQYKAFKLYQSAAKKGDANAMLELSDFYEQGIWITRNHKKSITLLKKAANAGSIIAKWELESLKSRD